MSEYEPLSMLLEDEKVYAILNKARLPEEVCLLGKVVKRCQDEDVFEMYSFSRKLLAIITKKKTKQGSQWYVELKGNWKFY